MTFGAPEAEALYEGYAQKGFGVPSIDRSPFPLGLKAISEPIEIPRSLWGVEAPNATGLKKPVDQKAKQHKQINTNDNQ